MWHLSFRDESAEPRLIVAPVRGRMKGIALPADGGGSRGVVADGTPHWEVPFYRRR